MPATMKQRFSRVASRGFYRNLTLLSGLMLLLAGCGGGGGAAKPEPVVNRAPSDVTLSNSTVEENQPGAVIGTVSGADPDGDNLTFSIAGSDAASFVISDAALALAADLAANFEVKSKYSLTLSAADPSGASVSTEVEVTVVDVNDPPVFDLDLTLDVLENDIEPFATFRAFDEDDADGFQATYDLSGSDAVLFELANRPYCAPAPGTVCPAVIEPGKAIKFLTPPDFETPLDFTQDNIYDVDVVVSDGALSQTGTISVTVKNAVEGRVVDAPLSDSEVCIDLNADSQCQASETSVRSDAAGFYSLPAAGNVDGATRRVLSIGGTDIVTGKVMKSLAMVALMPIDPTKQVTVTPLSTVLSVSDDPQATMIALGLPAELTFEELSSFDPWILATENADAGSAAAAADLGLTQDALDQVVKDVISISTQIASLIETAETAVSDTTTAGVQSSEERAAMLTSSVVRAVSTAIAKESLANGGATKVSLASSTLVTEVLIETVESSAVTIVQAVETKQASGEIDGANLNAETFAAIIELKQASEVITQTGLDVAATSAVTAVANNTAKVNQQIDNLVQTTGGAALNDKNAADALVDLIETTNDLANQLVDGDISIETFVDAADVDEIASRAGGLVDLVKEVVENGANPDSGATDGSGTTDGPGITDGSGTTSGGTTDGSSDGSGTTSGGTTDGSSDGSGATSGGTTSGGTTDGTGTSDGGTTSGGTTDGTGTSDGDATTGGTSDGGTTSGGTTDGSGTSDGGETTGGSGAVIENQPPVLSDAVSALSIAENSLLVVQLSVSDPEESEISYSVSGVDKDLFAVSASGLLAFAITPDFETPGDTDGDNRYVVTVTATDVGGASVSQDLTISVTDVNESPLITSAAALSAAENQTAIGTITASDAEGATVTFTLGGDDAASFSISEAGVLTFAAAPNFESKATYAVTVSVGDGANTTSQALTVSVTDVNEAPLITSEAALSAAENQTAIGVITASDAEGATVTFTLGGDDAASFSISEAGVLTFAASPDFETKSTYAVTVSVGDGTSTTDQALSISVTDVNESPVITSIATFSAAENQTAIGVITASDAEGATVTFTLGGDDASSFSISEAGVLSFVAAPNYEAQSSYSVTITVSDGETTSSSELTIAVSNVNEGPTITSASTAEVAENTTAVETLTSTDPDGDALSYALSGDDAGVFDLDTSNLALIFKAAPDFETPIDADENNTYLVTLTVADGNGGTVVQDLTITVTDVNEAPLITSAAALSAAENQTAIGTITASDAEGATVTFTLGGDDAASFSISEAGVLTFAAAPNFETKSTYAVTVSVGDGANTTSQALTVSVTDINEAPVISSSLTLSAAENQTVIGVITASDAEGGDLIYTLSGDDAASFSISSAGVLSFVASPDFETKSTYAVTVSVGDGTNTTSQALTISMTDVNESPVITGLNTSLAVDENSLNVVQVTASDPDGDPVYYSVTGADKALFTISGSGLLAFVSAPDYETPQDADGNNVYEIAIEVSDAAPVSEKPGAKLKARRVQRNKVSAALSVSVNNIDEDLIAFSFTTTDGTATEAPTLSVALTIDALTEASEVQVLTWKIGGEQTWRTATRVDSLNWTISVSLDDTAASGTYEVRSVRIIRDGLSELSFTDTALNDKAFTITSDLYNTRSDSAPPTLTKIESITVSGNDSDVGTPIKVEIVATVDDGVGRLDKAFSYIKAPGGAITGAWAVLNDAGTEATFSFALDAKAGAGSYQIDDVRLYDAAGNEKFYNQTDLSNAGFTDTWSINNSIADNTAPAITDLYLIPSLDADDLNRKQITVYLTTDAPESALRNAYIRLISPSNANIDKYLLDLGRPFTTVVDGNHYALTISLPIEYPDGTYNIAYIFVDDAALNKRTYQVAELNGLEFNTNVVFGSGNDHAPDISSGSSFVVVENVATIGTVSATDYDSDSLGYTLAGTDAAALMINGSGVLSFVSAADFEVQSSYAVSVAVSDGTNTSTQDLTITVTDVDESPVVTSSLNLSASENQTAIGTIAASDAEGAAVTFSLSGDDAASFSLSSSGVLSFVAAPNFESQSSYTVTITVSDGTNASSSDLTIAVTNVNEAPTMTSAAQASVAENTAAVITLTSTDPDGDTLSYALSGNDAALFDVDASNAALSFKVAPDFETPSDADGDNIYLITVTASDGNGASATQDLTITVTDVNETVTGVLIDGYLAGATVFQDLNNNGAPDAGEPQTTTDVLGNFTLTLQSSSPDARVRVVNTGFDIGANDVLGAMLDISPRTSGQYIMTPLSTLAARMMSFNETMTKGVAEKVIADAVDVDLAQAPEGALFGYDPIKKLTDSDATVAAKAQNVYAANQQLMALGNVAGGSATHIAQRAMAQAQSALQTILDNNGLSATASLTANDLSALAAEGHSGYLDGLAEHLTLHKPAVDAFRLDPGAITLIDYVNGSQVNEHQLYPVVNGSTLNSDLVGGRLDLSNFYNLLTSKVAATSPTVRFGLNSIPAAGTSGTTTITLTIFDGTDAVRSGSEKQISATMDVNWSSDGATVSLVAPTQTVTVGLVSSSVTVSAKFTNNTPDALSFNQNGPVKPASLELRLGAFIPANIPFLGNNPESYFTAGNYFLEVGFTGGLDLRAANDAKINKLQAGFTLVEDPGVYLYADDVIVSEGAGQAQVEVRLSQPAAATVTVNYEAIAGTATTSDFTATGGTLSIAAGETSGFINVPLTNDSANEAVEAFTINLSSASGASLAAVRPLCKLSTMNH